METIIINPPYQDNVESFIREHKDEFISGVDSNWIKQHPIKGLTTIGIQRKLNVYCNVVKHNHREGKKVISTRIYTLNEEIFNKLDDKPIEVIKYVDIATQTKPIKRKSVINQLKEFYDTEYKRLPYNWRPREYFNYYNEHHIDKVSYDKFIKYMPFWDYIILS